MVDIEVPRTKVEVTQEDIDKGIPKIVILCSCFSIKKKI